MTERFSDALLDEIRSRVPITEVVGQHVVWDRAKSRLGDQWACCPFHGESTPSFHADDEKGIYHCFGCGVNGDHFKFVMDQTGVSFPEAVEVVAELAGVPLPDRGESRPATTPEQPRQEKAKPQPIAAEGQRKLVKTYDYTDRHGNLIFQVCRFQIEMPDGSFAKTKDRTGTWKTFLQRRPANIGDGSWIWGLSAGDFMRPGPGKDWSAYDEKKRSEWPNAEIRTFAEGVEHTVYRLPAVEIAIAEGKTILIVEGEKDADTSAELGWCGTTNSSGSKHWTAAHAACFRDADVVICLDNDEAGDRADKLARSLKGIARRVRVLDFAKVVEGFDHKGDITDWVEKFGGTSEQLERIIAGLPDWRPRPPISAMGAVGLHQLHHPSLKHDFLIDGFLDRQGVAMMPGASGSGKTFLILEMAMCTALNLDFWGMKVKPGLVLYQAGEGKQGVTKRLDGWMLDRGISPSDDIPFQMLTRRINLFNDDKDTDDIIAEGRAWSEYYGVPVRMVVIDTFNKAITGANENAGQDMTKVLSRLERISVTLDCAVVVPIHKSAEGKMRGHTSLTGDVSNVINVTELEMKDRNQRIIRTVTLDKNKDGEKGRPMRFVLRQVVLDPEPDGKIVTTCVVDRPDGDEEEAARQGKLSLNQFLILKALKDALEDHGEPAPAGIRAGSALKVVVKYQHWVDRVRKVWVFQAPENEPEKRNKELERVMTHAGKVLLAGEYIGRDNDLKIVWHTGKEDRPKREKKVEAPPPPLPADVRQALNEGVPF